MRVHTARVDFKFQFGAAARWLDGPVSVFAARIERPALAGPNVVRITSALTFMRICDA